MKRGTHRQKRSISILCRHVVTFLESRRIFFADNVKDVCEANGFDNRRTYDVICVLKSLGLVQKLSHCSASYVWIGRPGFDACVDALKKFGFQGKFNGKFTLGFVTYATLFLLVNKRCSLDVRQLIQALRDIHVDCAKSESNKRRVYDIVNILSCFPSLMSSF
jgi:hypothetical protein